MINKIDKDKPLWVKSIFGVWFPAHATGHIDTLGRVGCYSDGRTSHTKLSDDVYPSVIWYPVYSINNPVEMVTRSVGLVNK